MLLRPAETSCSYVVHAPASESAPSCQGTWNVAIDKTGLMFFLTNPLPFLQKSLLVRPLTSGMRYMLLRPAETSYSYVVHAPASESAPSCQGTWNVAIDKTGLMFFLTNPLPFLQKSLLVRPLTSGMRHMLLLPAEISYSYVVHAPASESAPSCQGTWNVSWTQAWASGGALLLAPALGRSCSTPPSYKATWGKSSQQKEWKAN